MIDEFGRQIEYLRLSLTERCNLNCIYCREQGCSSGLPVNDEITAPEIAALMRQVTRLGVNKVRLTGGEPLMRRDLERIVRAVADSGEIQDLCMTTNAQGLAPRARALRESGLMRINVSLDSLCPDKFERMTRGGSLKATLDGIEAAVAAGISPVKINVVTVRGYNDDEINDFIALAEKQPVDIRFIELMPFGALGRRKENRISNEEILAARPDLRPLAPRYAGQPSEDYAGAGFAGRVGFISPLSHRFCNLCNRVRVTSDAKLRPCLGNNLEIPLRPALATGDADALYALLRDGIFHKPEGHHFEQDFRSDRGMSRIGG